MSSKLIAGTVAVALLAAAGFGGWWFFVKGDAPPPVSLDEAVAGLSTATATNATTATTVPGTAATGTATTTASTVAPVEGDLSGTWEIDPAVDNFVGYRIDEELASIGAKTAVGRTADVTGTLEFDGERINVVDIAADLTGLSSDDDRRDGQLRRQALETGTYPEATFTLTEPIAIEGDPASGEPITTTAIGDLTIHGVTQRVELPLEGKLVGDVVVVVGSLVILLADYGIEKPTAPAVLSVSDEATMEFQLNFRRA